MDPTNITPTSNPVPPVMPGANSVAEPAQPVAPVNPVVNPTQPMATTPAEPVMNSAPSDGTPNPINPMAGVPNPASSPQPVNPVFRPTNIDGVNSVPATDPIMMPEPASAPDPIEEELKAPMKAAGPVPGSIGSAVSMPATENGGMGMQSFETMPEETTAPPSVAFNDPAMQPDNANTVQNAKPVKKKTSKGTLIALAVILFVVAAVLAVFLVMQLNGGM